MQDLVSQILKLQTIVLELQRELNSEKDKTRELSVQIERITMCLQEIQSTLDEDTDMRPVPSQNFSCYV